MVMKQLKIPHKNYLLSKISLFSRVKVELTVEVATTTKYGACVHYTNNNRAFDKPTQGTETC